LPTKVSRDHGSDRQARPPRCDKPQETRLAPSEARGGDMFNNLVTYEKDVCEAAWRKGAGVHYRSRHPLAIAALAFWWGAFSSLDEMRRSGRGH
jgi:hypothetical protein